MIGIILGALGKAAGMIWIMVSRKEEGGGDDLDHGQPQRRRRRG
jgi:hypothetical protein